MKRAFWVGLLGLLGLLSACGAQTTTPANPVNLETAQCVNIWYSPSAGQVDGAQLTRQDASFLGFPHQQLLMGTTNPPPDGVNGFQYPLLQGDEFWMYYGGNGQDLWSWVQLRGKKAFFGGPISQSEDAPDSIVDCSTPAPPPPTTSTTITTIIASIYQNEGQCVNGKLEDDNRVIYQVPDPAVCAVFQTKGATKYRVTLQEPGNVIVAAKPLN